jgi:hypothetical protein
MRPRPLWARLPDPISSVEGRTEMGLINGLKAALRRTTMQDAELDYLSQSTSTVDLELRQREIDRGRLRHPRRA